MNSVSFGLIAAEMLHQSQQQIQEQNPVEETEKLPPWATAKIDILKAIRKGKTYEEILMLKKKYGLNKIKK
jgi:hypothetical protein